MRSLNKTSRAARLRRHQTLSLFKRARRLLGYKHTTTKAKLREFSQGNTITLQKVRFRKAYDFRAPRVVNPQGDEEEGLPHQIHLTQRQLNFTHRPLTNKVVPYRERNYDVRALTKVRGVSLSTTYRMSNSKRNRRKIENIKQKNPGLRYRNLRRR